MSDPIRPTDDDARHLANDLVRTARSAALATLQQPHDDPFASLVAIAADVDGTPLTLVSALSGHTANLRSDPRCSLLCAATAKGDPLAHPRVTLICRARRVERLSEEGNRVRRRFLNCNPKSELYVDFPDFMFLVLDIQRASLNGGFGKAYELSAADVRTDVTGAQELVVAETDILTRLNGQQRPLLSLVAKAVTDPEALGGVCWRCIGIDPEGLDLVSNVRSARIRFPFRVVSPAMLDHALEELAHAAPQRTS